VRLSDPTPLWYVSAVEAALVLVLVLLVLTRGAMGDRRVSRDARRLDTVRAALGEAAGTPGAESLVREAVSALPLRLQVSVLTELLPNLAGRQRALLSMAAAGSDITVRAEAWCCSRLWWRRRQGVRLLALFGSGSTFPVRLLTDARRAVRAQAVAGVAAHPTPQGIEALLDMLGDPRQAAPFLVKDALVRIGPPVVPPLIRFLTVEDGPRRGTGLEVAIALADPRTVAAALAASTDRLPENRALAATLAGALGGEDAVERLREMLDDPHPDVRAASAAGLGACAHWPAAAQVAALLGDRAWTVRSGAALALGAMGAPGLLMLRRVKSAHDPFARDAAHRVLDLLENSAHRRSG
jgi:HEAT repeat protein